MATKTILIDDITGDITGDKADATVCFSFDNSDYEIDLTDEHINEFANVMQLWITHARKVPKGAGGSRKRTPRNDETPRIREWALNNGYKPGLRGRIPAEIVRAYHKSTKE